MIKLTLLGTCSGTEPMPNRHYCSLVFEINDKLYWFDAGENCSHRAYTMGMDVSTVRGVFISHMHIDHIGGLANLIFTIYKDYITHKTPHINNNSYDIFVPDLERFLHIKALVPGHRHSGITMLEHEVKDGVVFEENGVKITSLHNTHLGENKASDSICSLYTSYMNHLMSFGAGDSRLADKVVNLDDFSNKI